MQTKIRVGVLFGGQSAEHDVSLLSARSIIEQLDPTKYVILPIGVDKTGSWHFLKGQPSIASMQNDLVPTFEKDDPNFPLWRGQEERFVSFSPCILRQTLDVAFPVFHGPYGEDGTMQGLLELAGLPYVGPDHLSSAICMDKGVMKEILKGENLLTARQVVLRLGESVDEEKILAMLGLPLFVKPAQMGSSVGITKVYTQKELASAIAVAFQYGSTAVVEEYISGREIECAILGNENPKASLPGEVVPQHDFYSYEAKYLGATGADLIVPAKLTADKIEEVQHLAIQAFKALRCEGMARVDFFLKQDGTWVLNELNTIPGFTSISLYPKLWEVSGIAYPQLLDQLLELALERFARKKGFRK